MTLVHLHLSLSELISLCVSFSVQGQLILAGWFSGLAAVPVTGVGVATLPVAGVWVAMVPVVGVGVATVSVAGVGVATVPVALFSLFSP